MAAAAGVAASAKKVDATNKGDKRIGYTRIVMKGDPSGEALDAPPRPPVRSIGAIALRILWK
ncbi:hypothetical protein ACFB49_04900 [Sphingomonas sp. DBB INV C78]